MDADHQILCLSMIVKNKAPVIARCLASVRPIVDYWVIVDTGSTDGTQDAIHAAMADLPGELHERPWRNFAHNGTEALELAQPHGEYVLWLDPDDVLEFETEFRMPTLHADSYMLRVVSASISCNKRQIIRAALPWRWRGLLHEFLSCGDARSSGVLEGLRLRRNHDGARRRDPETSRREAEILYAALQTESDPSMQSRYQFYLAQSYRECGEREKALQAYLRRAELGFCVEEVFVSLYYAAELQEALGRPFDEVMATYLRAANAVPSRATEALHGASRYCRLTKQYFQGWRIVTKAHPSGEAPDGLFVQPWIYEYGLLDEFAVNAYWAGAYQDSLDACERVLRERKCPESERPRIEANAAFARQRLGNVAVSARTDVSVAVNPRTAKDTILGACVGYPAGKVRPFIDSLRRWYDGNVSLVTAHLPSDTKLLLKRYAVHEIEIDLPLPYTNIFLRRFEAYNDFIRTDTAIDRIFLVDVRDVFFQGDPFNSFPDHDLAVYLEDDLIGNCPDTSRWIDVLYGKERVSQLSRCVISCAGTTAGHRAGILLYLERMQAEIRKSVSKSLPVGADQGMHNHLVYGELGNALRVQNRTGAVQSLNYQKQFTFDRLGRMLNADGTVCPILHQIDRYPQFFGLLDISYEE